MSKAPHRHLSFHDVKGSGTLLVRLYKDVGTPVIECSPFKFWKAPWGTILWVKLRFWAFLWHVRNFCGCRHYDYRRRATSFGASVNQPCWKLKERYMSIGKMYFPLDGRYTDFRAHRIINENRINIKTLFDWKLDHY